MPRRIASQVHQQASRLLRSNYLQQEPAWYKAVLENPPLPLPPRKALARTQYDLPPSNRAKLKPHGHRPLPIFYVEDDVRRQFFRDHPFEAWRPMTLVEGGRVADEHPIQGATWTRLSQRGRNPSADDAIRFAVNLYEYHEIPLSEAYSRAVAQFRSLRSEHHVANSVAALEAEAHNAVFGRGEIERGVEVEMLGLSTWDRREELDEGAIAARKRWKAILDRSSRRGGWSKGQEYVRLWKAGVRPTYLPALEEEPQAPVRRKSIMSEVSDFVAAPVKKPQDGSTP